MAGSDSEGAPGPAPGPAPGLGVGPVLQVPQGPRWDDDGFVAWVYHATRNVDADDFHDPGRLACGSAPQSCPLWEWTSLSRHARGACAWVRFFENQQLEVGGSVQDGRWLQVGPAPPGPAGEAMCIVTMGIWDRWAPAHPLWLDAVRAHLPPGAALSLQDVTHKACPWLPDDADPSGHPVAPGKRLPPRDLVITDAALLVPEQHVGDAVVALLPRVAHATHACCGAVHAAMPVDSPGQVQARDPPLPPTSHHRYWYYGSGAARSSVAGALEVLLLDTTRPVPGVAQPAAGMGSHCRPPKVVAAVPLVRPGIQAAHSPGGSATHRANHGEVGGSAARGPV